MTLYSLIIIIPVLLLIGFLMKPTLGFLKASRLNAKIPFSKCLMMSTRNTLTTEVIKAIAFSQEKSSDIGIDTIEAHFLAGGSPLKCLEAIEYAKSKNQNLDFSIVSAAELTGKDLIQAIDKAQDIWQINIRESNIRDEKQKPVTYEYRGSFKVDFGRICFALPDNEKIESEVKNKILKYLEYSDTSDSKNTAKKISEILLDTNYWTSKGFNLINQEIKINE